MEKNTLWMEFSELCDKLSAGDAIGFSCGLRSFIYYLYSKGIINHHTVEKLCDDLKLDNIWTFIRDNPDGTQSYYIEGVLYDTKKPEAIIEKVIRDILSDSYFVTSIEYASMQGLEALFKNINITVEWILLYTDLKKLRNPVFSENRVLWLEPNGTGSYNLCSVRGNINSLSSINKDIMDVLYEGIQSYIAYVKEDDCVYLKVYGMDAYVCYDLNDFSEKITYHRNLIRVDDNGNVKDEERKDKDVNIATYGKIGNFTYEAGKLKIECDFVNKGKVIDDIICCDNPHNYPGQVFFDRVLSCYMIKWNGDNNAIIKEVEKRFVRKYTACDVQRFDPESLYDILCENDYNEDMIDDMSEDISISAVKRDYEQNTYPENNPLGKILKRIDAKIKELEKEEYLESELTAKLDEIKEEKFKAKKRALGLIGEE